MHNYAVHYAEYYLKTVIYFLKIWKLVGFAVYLHFYSYSPSSFLPHISLFAYSSNTVFYPCVLCDRCSQFIYRHKCDTIFFLKKKNNIVNYFCCFVLC